MAQDPIRSGRYSPNLSVTLTVWNEGDPAPDGYDVEQTSDGSRVAVVKDRGEVRRDAIGNAYAIPEGGALAEYADGSVETLAGPDLDNFVSRYQLDSSGQASSTSADSAGKAADVQAASPTTTTAQGVTDAGNTGTTTDAANANDAANPQTAPASSDAWNSGGSTTAGGDAGTGQGA